MIRSARRSTGLVRHVYLTLATLAVALKILIPPGFMAGPQVGDLPFALVLCTAQGAVTVAPGDAPAGHADHDKAPADSAHDSPCVFAGHGLNAAPPNLIDVAAVEFVAYPYRPHADIADLAPGRGLTGPPLPARGPPSLLI